VTSAPARPSAETARLFIRFRNNSANADTLPAENEKESGQQDAHWRTDAASRDGHIAPERRRASVIYQGGKMSRIIITMSRTMFFRLLAHAPEELQREAKEDARRAIPAFCLTEDDIRERFAQEEQWEELSDDAQREAIQSLMDADEYNHAAKLADEAITGAVARYLHDAMLEKEERRAENEPT
jgi:hypothetical protein